MFQVSVIIPAYNEKESVGITVESVIRILKENNLSGEVIVVDDGSGDDTAVLAEAAGASVIRHGENLGYGASLKSGLKSAKGEILIITDADGTYPLDRIPDLVKKMEDTGADMVVGARTGADVNVPLIRRPFKKFLRHLASYIVQRPIPDLNSGLRAFTRETAFRYFHLYPNGFSFTSTITVASLCDGLHVEFMPIDYHKRVGRSKIVFQDFFSFVVLVLRLSVLFNPLRVFIPVSVFCFGLGSLKLVQDVWTAIRVSSETGASLIALPVVSTTAVTFLLASLQIVLVGMVAEALARQNARNGGLTGKNH